MACTGVIIVSDGQPIVVDPNAGATMALTAIRYTALIISGGIAIGGMARGHDLNGLIAYVQSDTFATVLSAFSMTAIYLYGMVRELKRKAEAVIMADAAPDAVAVVGKPPRGWFGRLVDRIRAL